MDIGEIIIVSLAAAIIGFILAKMAADKSNPH